jgi:hypothetical protein
MTSTHPFLCMPAPWDFQPKYTISSTPDFYTSANLRAMNIPSKDQICMPRQIAYIYLIITIGMLLFVGVVEWLNGKRIARLMAMLEELIWDFNTVEEEQNN